MIENETWRAVAVAIASGLNVSTGERVGIFLTDVSTIDFLAALTREIYRRGAVPHVILADERVDRIAAVECNVAALEQPASIEELSLRHSDVHISVRGMVPPDELAGKASAGAIAAQRKAKGAISALRWRETRWAIARIPTRAWAEYLDVPFDTLLTEFAAGCLFDWERSRDSWRRLVERIDRGRSVTIEAPDTELRLSIVDRRAALFAGEANWPDGEVATAPVENDVNGHIVFPDPFVFASQRIEGLRLEFEDGLVTRLDARVGASFAEALLDTDAGSRLVGELGIGLNSRMTTLTQDLFFDEKILGTVHIAMGRAYPQCGGVNQSDLHWDIVKDLRVAGGQIRIDGDIVMRGAEALW